MNINIIVMIIIMHYYTCISAHEYEYRVTIVNPLYYNYNKAIRRKNGSKPIRAFSPCSLGLPVQVTWLISNLNIEY